MSVLQLRRDMVVDDTSAVSPSGMDSPVDSPVDSIVEIDTPFPLRTINVTPKPLDGVEHEHEHDFDDERDHRTFGEHVRGWFTILAVISALGVYPTLVVLSSDVGDRNVASLVDRTQWTAPWAGGASVLMERHFAGLGWASDAPSWSPMARLTAKPAYQAALAEAVGEYVTLMNTQAKAAGRPDPDLEAAARLVSINSTGVQLRAARDALVNFDRRERRRGAPVDADPARLAAQLSLIESWAMRSQGEVVRVAAMMGGNPIDESATRAVYAAKGRAQAAYIFIETMHWPEEAGAVAARGAALEAWEAAAEFHPLVVLNGSPDGWLLGNHATSMGFLLAQAQAATAAYIAELGAAPAAAIAPVASVEPAADPLSSIAVN